MPERAIFPRARAEHESEWPGTQIGLSNIVTRCRAPVSNSDLDVETGRFERLLASAKRRMAGRRLFIHDAAIHGLRVRVHTNSHHLADFWRRNWYSVEEWRERTGLSVGPVPRVRVYAFGEVEDQPESANYSRARNTVFLFNTSWYEDLRERTLSAVARVLAEEEGIHSVRLGAVSRGDGSAAVLCPPQSVLLRICREGAVYHSHDLTFVRCGFPRTAFGEFVSPRVVRRDDGPPMYGAASFRWLEENRDRDDAIVEALSLWDEPVELRARDLDRDCPRAMGFASEKAIYLRTDSIRSYPTLAGPLLAAPLENVPDVGQDEGSQIDQAASMLETTSSPLRRLPPDALRNALRRLCGSDLSRAMVDPRALFGEARVSPDPLRPFEIQGADLSAMEEGDAVHALRRCARVAEKLDARPPNSLLER